jgi:hypothetical protein
MATEYGFEMSEPATADKVTGVFTHAAVALGLTEEEVRFEPPGMRLRSGVLVAITASTPLPFPDPVEEEFGFAPAVGVLFRFLSSRDSLEQEQDMIRLVVAALAALSGDALLDFAGEIVWLLRRGGRLTISKGGDFWIPELVDLLPPHDRARLPNL